MTGPATYARDADAASAARDALDEAAGFVEEIEGTRRRAMLALTRLWATSAWLVAGCSSPRRWLEAYTSVSWSEVDRLVRLAALCAGHPLLREAVATETLPLARAELIARFATREREAFLADSLPALLAQASSLADDRDFAAVVRHWAELVDQELDHAPEPRHRLVMTQSLFGNGHIDAQLSPSAFVTVAAALDAFCQDPDPADAPHRRSLAERRADALDDMAHHVLTDVDTDDYEDLLDDDVDNGEGGNDLLDEVEALEEGEVGDIVDDDDAAGVFEDSGDRDLLDEALDASREDDDDTDEALTDRLDILRRRLRHLELRRRRRLRRRTKIRSGVTANIHLDLRTLAGRHLGDPDALDGLTLRGDGWAVAERAARRLLCDSALVATLFAGPKQVLDANSANERFTRAQRRAIATRDGCCVFPSCTRPARWCDTHHVHPRGQGGPSVVDNGALLCRFHHRLVHEYGWSLEVDDTGHWVATDRHGTTWTGRPVAVSGTGAPRPPDRPAHQDAA